tara:strand:- start:2508 stop:3014 length:507 start_codon:yes stop_codon:yes gene_type:complete
MFAGKTTELLNRLKKINQTYLLIKPKIDTRNSGKILSTHGGTRAHAITVSQLSEVFDKLENIKVVAIDEAQFFKPDIIQDIHTLSTKNITIIIAGLEKDYLNKPFGPMQEIIKISTSLTRLTAICNQCKGEANYSHRIKKDTKKQVLIGDANKYQALCEECFDKITKL